MPLTLERVARFPAPGMRVAGSFRFGHDGRHLYYLKAEGAGEARSLWREAVAGGRPEVIGRPPAAREDERTLSREEILRRERRRIQDRGITQYDLASAADAALFVSDGDLFLARPGGGPIRLTATPAEEIDPHLSPDGRSVAFVRDGELHVLDLGSRSERRLTSGARDGVTHGLAEFIAQEEMDRASGFWWSPDGARLAYAAVDETGIPVYSIVHQGTPRPEIEPHRYPFAGGPNARVRLGIVPAAGGPTEWLTLAPPEEEFYLARAEWGRDGALVVQVQSRDQTRLRLLRFGPRGGAGRTLLEERSETWINLHDDFRPLPDGRFLWTSETGGFRHVELRAADGALLRTLTSGPWSVDAIHAVDPASGFAFFTAARDGPLDRPLYRVPLDGGPIERITPEPGFHTITAAPDGRAFVDLHDSAGRPPRALLRDAGGRVQRILDPNDDPEPARLGLRPPEFVTVAAPDGTPLHAAIYRPEPFEAGHRYPALVAVYGGPGSQTVRNSWDLTAGLRAQHLRRRGYVVFRIDNRGTPRRGRAFETALHHRLGSVEVEDQIAGARHLAGLPYVDPQRIGVYGWSYGGYMAARLILLAPDLFRAAVAGAPVADWDGYDTHYTERYMGTPAGNAGGYRAASLLPLAENLRGALLIVHGMIDENVHFRHTARLIAALNAAGRPYELLALPEERHLPRGEDDRRRLEERILEHFDRHLRPSP